MKTLTKKLGTLRFNETTGELLISGTESGMILSLDKKQLESVLSGNVTRTVEMKTIVADEDECRSSYFENEVTRQIVHLIED